MNISIETLDAIRKELPNGAQAIIAKRTNYSEQTVSHVLTGKVEVNATNMVIISEAQKEIMEFRKKKAELENQIEELNKDTKK